MNAYQKVLFDDDEYEYIYSYTSCSENDDQHKVKDCLGPNSMLYYDISYIIKYNSEALTWEDIENTELGVKVPKVVTLRA